MWLAFLVHIVFAIIAQSGVRAIQRLFETAHDLAMRAVARRVDHFAWSGRWLR